MAGPGGNRMSAERSTNGKQKPVAPVSPPLNVKGGDERQGFEMAVDRARRLLRMRMWGFWEGPTGELFMAAALLFARGLAGAPWCVLADTREYMAQSERVTELRKQTMIGCSSMGCTKIAAIVSGAAYLMQFKRIANESQVGSATFQDEASAMAWLFGDSGKVAVPDSRNKLLPSQPFDHRRNRR
jgi:hypothetical protein